LDFLGFSKGYLLSTLGLHPAKIQQRNFISKIQKKPPKHRGNPCTQFRFGVLGIFQGKFAKCHGPSSSKNEPTPFHKQDPEKTSKA